MKSMTANDIEIAVSDFFGTRENLIVPNISWGLHLHECDLVVMRPSRFLYEVEIKVSKGDMKADLAKKHHHSDEKIKRLYFAIPEELKANIDLIPEHAGIIICYRSKYDGEIGTYLHRPAKDIPGSRKLTAEEVIALSRLGLMRLFKLKKKVRDYKELIIKWKNQIEEENK